MLVFLMNKDGASAGWPGFAGAAVAFLLCLAVGCAEPGVADGPAVEASVKPIVHGPGKIAMRPAPAPAPVDTQVSSCTPMETESLPALQLTWEQVLDAGISADVEPDALELHLKNTREYPIWVELRYEADAGSGVTTAAHIGSFSLLGGHEAKRTIPTEPGLPLGENMETSGLIFAAARVTNEETGEREFGAVSPPLFWHRGGPDTLDSESPTITVYDQLTHEQVFSGGDLLGKSKSDGAFVMPSGETGQGIPSRVMSGPAAIVTPGSTTPNELVTMGLLTLAKAPKEEDL